MMIQLSKRLQAVADLLTENDQESISCVADVGTDHGYIPIYLVEKGICKCAIAMDIRKGPLERAIEHIEEHQLKAYIETRLSDGVAALKEAEADAIVIAGMGGATMQGILEAGVKVIAPGTILVLQPQSEVAEFRQYLQEHGFELLAEDMVCEEGKFYPMMKVRCGRKQPLAEREAAAGTEDSDWEAPENVKMLEIPGWCLGETTAEQKQIFMLYGPMLLQQRHPVLKEFLLWQQDQKHKILANLKQNGASDTRNRRVGEIEAELDMIAWALKMYEEV